MFAFEFLTPFAEKRGTRRGGVRPFVGADVGFMSG